MGAKLGREQKYRWVGHDATKAGVHLKAVFWLDIMVLMQISRAHFKQSKISHPIGHRTFFVNLLVTLGIFGEK